MNDQSKIDKAKLDIKKLVKGIDEGYQIEALVKAIFIKGKEFHEHTPSLIHALANERLCEALSIVIGENND